MTELNNYYANYDEDTRLKRDNLHQIEYLTTLHFLKKYIPDNSKILDSCAGTGTYAFALARDGHTVTAGDIVEKHAEIMRHNSDAPLLHDIYCGDTLNMSQFPDGEFDAVLCMGALYHLLTYEEREKAVRECLRVLKSGGTFAFTYITRQSLYILQHMISVKCTDVTLRLSEFEKFDEIASSGIWNIFYGMTPDEPDEIMQSFNLTKITNAAAYPFVYRIYQEINDMDADEFNNYMKCHIATCENESVVKHTMHGLYICKKIAE